MKHSPDDSIFQTNLLQALQKNKVIQGRLIECQHTYYIQLLKDMQVYNLKEKYNRELLYSWKKESYIRQLKKKLEEHQRKNFGVKDAYYEYQLRNLDNVIGGQQGLVIPASEQERRLNINAKYRQFLQKNPLQTSSSMRIIKSANIPNDQNKNEIDQEEDTHNLEKNSKYIHARSVIGLRGKENNILPVVHRSSTMNEIRRNKSLTKSRVSPTVCTPSSVLVTTTSKLINSSLDEKFQRSPRSPTKFASNDLGLSDSIDPLLLTPEISDINTRSDLVAMRSVRRPRKNPSDLNLIFETRKRIYQINRRALDEKLYLKKCRLPQNIQFDPSQQINLIISEGNLPVHMNENNPTQTKTIII